MTFAAPDYARELEGWRAWRVVEQSEGPRLQSVHYDTIWRPRVPLRATCKHRRRSLRHPVAGRPPAHGAPVLDCRCGIHAVLSAEQAIAYLAPPFQLASSTLYALGPVALWGDVAEHTEGWRAGVAYPRAINLRTAGSWSPERLTAVAAGLACYGVPVGIVELEPAAQAPDRDVWSTVARYEGRLPAGGR